MAIIGGQPDGSGHPYAGAVDTRLAGAPVPGSGVLISPTVFLTAGHVTRFFDRAGQTRARVTFDPVVSDSSTWYWGTVHTNPAFNGQVPAADTNDLGVVVFDSPIPGITPASLPTTELLDQLGSQSLANQSFQSVGYGMTTIVGGPNDSGIPQNDLATAGTRRVAQTSFMSLTPAWLRLQQVDGGPAFGDSGGPTLLGSSNVVVGIWGGWGGGVEFGNGDAWDVRLDTPAHRAFLGQYVTLP
jgi:Trypsin-like peptidase domain